MAEEITLRKIREAAYLGGEITPPGDKSICHRALILNSLAEGVAKISNPSPGEDCRATINCLKALGAKIQKGKPLPSPTLLILGTGRLGLREAENVLDARNSATTMRLLSGLLSAQPFLSIISGDASLRSRPMKRLIEPLRLMGAEIWGRDQDSFAPLVIRGKQVHGIDYSLPVPSAQIKSAILLAGLFAQGKTAIYQTTPSRNHTELMLREMGAELETDGNWISLTPLSAPLAPISFHIPGDISSAAYWLVAAAIHPDARVKIMNCGINPTRTGIIDVLLAMGAKLKLENQRLEGNEPVADLLIESSELKGIEIAGDIIPRLIDEIPVLAVAGCAARGNTTIRGAGELRVKESDRIANVAKELSKFSARIEELPDGMVIHGGKLLRGTDVDSHLDHRLAASLAIAGLVAKGETTVHHAQVVKVSYPTFWEELEMLTGYQPGEKS